MPDIGPVQPPATPPEPEAPRPRRTFQEIFQTRLAREEPVSPEREAELAAFLRTRMQAEARAVHLVRTYSATEKDEALYAVETDKGTLRVIRGRDGSLTLFE